MKEAPPSLEKQNVAPEIPVCCSQCGWPGTGKMPAGVGVIRQKGKTVLVGSSSYFRKSTVLCSLCQEMESAVATPCRGDTARLLTRGGRSYGTPRGR